MDHEVEARPDPKPVGAFAFLRAITSEAWTWFAYGGGAVILTIWGYITGGLPPAWVFLAVIAAGFLVGGYKTWRSERIERNATVRRFIATQDQLLALQQSNRSQFIAELAEPSIDGDHEHPDWIKIYMDITLRNSGAASAVDR